MTTPMTQLDKRTRAFCSILAVALIVLAVNYYRHHHVPKNIRDKVRADLTYKPVPQMTKEQIEAKVKSDLTYKPAPKMTKDEIEAKVRADLTYTPVSSN